LGDPRRDRRFVLMVERACDNPTASILQASQGADEAKGAYRLLSNEALEGSLVRKAAAAACVRRVRDELALAPAGASPGLLLVVQDTTELDYSKHPASGGLGPTGGGDGSAGHGMFVHSALAVSAAGLPLGLLHQQTWARDEQQVGSRHERKQRPFVEKESYRWVQTMQAVEQALPADLPVLHLADREGDIFEVFAAPRRAGSHLLIRAAQDRCLDDPQRHLFAAAAVAPVVGGFELLVRRAPGRAARAAQLEVRVAPITLRVPVDGCHAPDLTPVALHLIWLYEPDPPANQTPVHWLLLTDLPVSNLEQARTVAGYYALRWLIERYHYTLKSGCRIQDAQLREADRIERLLVLYCLVAWRLLWLTYAARRDGEQPCTVAFCDLEWQTLWRYFQGRTPFPPVPPALHEAVRWTALLGGFLGRTGDGEPGVKVLWRGLSRLQDIVTGVLLVTSQDVGKG
jgi:hypothetical protein